MPARTTRQQARERVIKAFMSSLDKVIPPDEAAPLKGDAFRDWEGQASELRRAAIPTLLEERAALEESARAEEGGICPHCLSGDVYLEGQETSGEVPGPDGPVAFPKQHCRCRRCGGFFPPQMRDWSLPAEVPLTPKAAEKAFGSAARSLNYDWETHPDARQVQR